MSVRFRLASFALLWVVLGLLGCTSEEMETATAPDTSTPPAKGDAQATEELPETLLEPFDPPPLAEIDAVAQWIDQPVLDGIEIFREIQAGEQPLVPVEEALTLKNDSAENNRKILSSLGRLPKSDTDVDWDATIIRHIPADLKSTNPLMISSTYEMDILDLVGLQLIGHDSTFAPFAQKWAVERWQVSKDRMFDKFILRDDITWSDGTPLTAEDVVFSFQTIMNIKVPIPAVRSSVAELRWVHAYDDRTLVIFHKEPIASWTENIQFPIIPKHIYEKSLHDDYTLQNSEYHVKYENNPVTCGPYRYVKRERGQEIVLERREDYFMQGGKQIRPKPYAKQIRLRIISDPNTTLLALRAGEVDEASISAEQWVTQTNGDDFYERNTKATGLQWVEFHFEWNCESRFFSDVRVRKAMSYAFDYDEMLDKFFYGLYEPCSGVFHHTGWMASSKPKPYKQDLDRAEELLDAAGWKDSDGDGVRDKVINGRKLKFEFTLIAGQTPTAKKVCTLMKDNLDQIGIICHVKPTEFTVRMQLALDHKFDSMMGGWGTGTDPSTLSNIFKTGEGRNHGRYSNERVDELFELAAKEFDREKRAALYAEIHEILYEDQPNTWLFYRPSFYGFNKRLRGYSFSPRGPYGVSPGFHSMWVPAY